MKHKRTSEVFWYRLNEKEDTAICNIIERNFNILTERKKKFFLSIPGIKGDTQISIRKNYYESCLRDNYKSKVFIERVYNFDYIGLGLHPANRNSMKIYIVKDKHSKSGYSLQDDKIYPIVSATLKINKTEKKFIDSFL